METPRNVMTPTRRYFLACDRLDIARHNGSIHRMNCMMVIVESLCDESAEALATDTARLMDELKDSIRQAYGKNKAA